MSERDKSGERSGSAAGQPEPDPLSATGMFLSAFGKEPGSDAVEDVMAPPKDRQPDPARTAELEVKREPARPVVPLASNSQGGPGEFTQMFQSLKPAAPFSSDAAPAEPLARAPSSQPPADRIVVQPFPSASAAPATPSAAPGAPAPARRGFSSPGVSDSASSESSSTQHFRAVPTPPAAQSASAPLAPRFSPAAVSQDANVTQPFRAVPTPSVASAPAAAAPPLAPAAPAPLAASPALREPRVSSPQPASSEGSFTQLFQATPLPAAAPTPSFSPLQEQRRDTPFELNDRPRPFADSGAKPAGKAADPSVTELFRSLSSPDTGQSAGSQSADPFASYSSPNAPPITRSPPPASGVGDVTMLMNKLAEEDSTPAPRPAPRAEATSGPVDSGPGEFTRIISGGAFAASASAARPAPAEPAPHAPFQMPTAPPMPKVPTPLTFAPPAPASAAIPLMHPAGAPPTHAAPAMPHAPALPHVAPPKLAIPPLAPPAVPAPKSKLQEMLPLLLVLNAFLLVVLIVIAFFALRSR